MPVADLDPTPDAIAEEARRRVTGELRMRVQGRGEEAVLVVEPVGMAPYLAQRLAADLRAFCAREGRLPRFMVVVSSTQPAWVPKTPEGWPPA